MSIEDVRIHKHGSTAHALKMFTKHSHGLSSVLESVMCSWGKKGRPGKFSRSVVCMVQRVKMEGKTPFSASRHVVSDLRLWGNKPSLEVESHGKNLLHHKALRSKGNRAEALVLAIA